MYQSKVGKTKGAAVTDIFIEKWKIIILIKLSSQFPLNFKLFFQYAC